MADPESVPNVGCLVLARGWRQAMGPVVTITGLRSPSLARGSARATFCLLILVFTRTLLMVINSAQVHRGGRNNVTVSQQRSIRRSHGVRAPCLNSTVASTTEKKQQKKRSGGKEEEKEEREELEPDAIR